MGLPCARLTTGDNVSIRYGVWPGMGRKKCGSVLFLNGRAEFLEKHGETIRELNQRGYDVYSMDWRGQGGSSRLLSNPHKGYVKSYTDYLRDLNCFYHHVVTPRAVTPVVILAHSMGAHIALRFLCERPGAADRMVLLSSMIDINTAPYPPLIARGIARLAIKVGWSRRYRWGGGDYMPDRQAFEDNRLTSDPCRFQDAHRAIDQAPHLATGDVTWRWLAATFSSIDTVKRKGFADRIHTPTLMISGQKDRIVTLSAQQKLCRRLPNCRLMIIPGARHEILKETDDIRAVFWDAFDQFVADDAPVQGLSELG